MRKEDKKEKEIDKKGRKRTGVNEEESEQEEEGEQENNERDESIVEQQNLEELDIRSGAAYNLGKQNFKNFYDKRSTVKV